MIDFKYVTPQSLAETIGLISEYGGKARIIGGGTDLLAKIKKGLPMPEILINIECVDDLHYIKLSPEGNLLIGAATSLAAIEKSELVKSQFPVLAQAIESMASPFLRNRATIGGNICNAAPSADTAPALLILKADVQIVGSDQEKIVPIEEFFSGPGVTLLGAGQFVTEIQIPANSGKNSAVYLKHKRRNGADLAVVGVGVLLAAARESGTLEEVRIALGAVAPTPIRAKMTERFLCGQEPSDDVLIEAGKIAASEARPIDDARSSAEYRKKLVEVLVTRALRQAVASERMEAQDVN